MTLRLLVLLLLLAFTNVTVAKSTLNGIASGQNMSDSPLVVSPNGLPSARILKQDTTLGTSHQAENAEERVDFGAKIKKITDRKRYEREVDRVRSQLGLSTPKMAFERAKLAQEEKLFESPAYKAWILFLQKYYPRSVVYNAISTLLNPKEALPDLASRLLKEMKSASIMEMARLTYDYLLSYLKETRKTSNEVFRVLFLKPGDPPPSAADLVDNPLLFIWVDFAIRRDGMKESAVLSKMQEFLIDDTKAAEVLNRYKQEHLPLVEIKQKKSAKIKTS